MNSGPMRRKGSRPILEALEDQILYSADALGGLDVLAFTSKDESTLQASELTGRRHSDDSSISQSQTSVDNDSTHAYELVFVDTDTTDYQQLVDDLLEQRTDQRKFDVFILDNSSNGIEQISDVLAGYDSLDAVHIISHGFNGAIDIGSTLLNAESLDENMVAIAAWGDAFDENGDILIYGCDLAADVYGQNFVERLAQITGTDVAASTDTTGMAALGGDWDLEYHYGNIESSIAPSDELQENWSVILAPDITTGLVGHWKFDADANDFSGNNYHGLLKGDAFIDTDNATDIVGEGKLSLDGTGDRVNLNSHSAVFANLAEGTISAWINTTDTDENTVFGVSDQSESFDLAKFSIESGQLKWLNINENGGFLVVNSNTTINDGSWHHVAVTVGSGGNTLYIDGVVAGVTYSNGSSANSDFFSEISEVDRSEIGRSRRGGSNEAQFDGLLDEVRVYDRALTSVDVAQLASLNAAPTGAVTIDNSTPEEDDLLTASNSLADEDGMGTITYQWQRDGVDILGAADSTYATVQADVGAAISVSASYIDGGGTAESVPSTATSNVINVNDAPTGSVTIDNDTPDEGDILTASNTLVDEDGLGAITYQWQRDGVNISSATGITYTTVQDDVGTAIRAVASYTDGEGTAESVASSVTANVNDPPTGAVTIDNTVPDEGDLLSASNTLADGDGLGTISYQWLRDSVSIAGATGSTYTTVQADVSTAIRVVASYTDGEGNAESVSSTVTADVENVNDAPTGAVTIDNTTPNEGDFLAATNTLADEDGLGAITYQWQRDGMNISGGTGSSYTTIQDDVGTAISVVASYTDSEGTAESVSSSATSSVVNVNDAPTGTVIIDNTVPDEGDLLTASNTLADEDGLGAINYQWQRDGVDISGATGSTYTTVQSDVDTAISVVASYTDVEGTPESVASTATVKIENVNDAPTGTVTIDNNTPDEGDLLTATNTLSDEDGLGVVTYQWQRDGANILGATGSTYTTVQDDVGTANSVVAIYTDDEGTAETVTSAKTSNVVNVNDAPTGAVTIDNTKPVEGDLLTTSNNLKDEDGVGTITYQWQSDGVNIWGATDSTYQVEKKDVYTSIRILLSYTDSGGTAESVSSEAVNILVESSAVVGGDTLYVGKEGDVVSGKLVVNEIIGVTDETSFVISKLPTGGTAEINPDSGDWTFTPFDENWFGSDTFTVEIILEPGRVTSKVVDVSLENVNDEAVIGGVDAGIVTEDVDLVGNAIVMKGNLTIADSDADESSFVPTAIDGLYGNFAIDAEGVWRYDVDNNQPMIQGLDGGQSVAESLTVTSVDGTQHIVKLEIFGSEDAPVISGVTTGEVATDQSSTYSNILAISDVDLTDNPIAFIEEAGIRGVNGFGTFALESGVWSYKLDRDHTAVQSLGFNELLSDSHTFLASDGTSQTVTVSIRGSNTQPIIAATVPDAATSIDNIKVLEGSTVSSAYEWLSSVAALTAPEDEAVAASVAIDTVGESKVTVASTQSKSVAIYREDIIISKDSMTVPVRQSQYETPPPIEDLLALDLVMSPVQDADLLKQQASDHAEWITSENLRRATQIMRDQMSDEANRESRSQYVADVVLRASGVTLSVGSFAWLLHGGSLVASALSSIPTWQGFDPLPVVANKSNGRWDRKKRRRDGPEQPLDEGEKAAAQIFDSMNSSKVVPRANRPESHL